MAALKNEATVFGRVRRFGLRNALVVVQVALSLVLLVSAGLFLRSLQHASSIDLGMKPDNILLLAFDPKLHNYSREKTRQFISELRQRVAALPGVRTVSFVDTVPLSIGGPRYPLYGVMSYSVRRRTREIGIRMALGAEPGKVLRMVLRQGLTVTAVGLAIGLGIALALGRFTASLLYGISGTDLLTFLTVPAVLVAAALPAIFFPAYRAARVEPTTALRYE